MSALLSPCLLTPLVDFYLRSTRLALFCIHTRASVSIYLSFSLLVSETVSVISATSVCHEDSPAGIFSCAEESLSCTKLVRQTKAYSVSTTRSVLYHPWAFLMRVKCCKDDLSGLRSLTGGSQRQYRLIVRWLSRSRLLVFPLRKCVTSWLFCRSEVWSFRTCRSIRLGRGLASLSTLLLTLFDFIVTFLDEKS